MCNLHLKAFFLFSKTKCCRMSEYLTAPYAAAHSKLTTCATTLPLNHKWGQLLKLSRETPSLHHRNIYPSNKLFLVWTSSCGWISIFASPLNLTEWYCILWPYSRRKLYEGGNHLQIGWITVGYRNQQKAGLSASSNPCPQDASQRFIFTQLWMVMAANRHMAVRLSGLGGKWGWKL